MSRPSKNINTHFEHTNKPDPDCMLCMGAAEQVQRILELQFAVEMGMETEAVFW